VVSVLKNRLKIARKNRGFTQDDLAKKVNTQKTTISNYETGYSTPSNEMLIDLAKALGVSTDYLLGISDVPELNRNSELETPIKESDDDIKKLMEDPDFMVAYKEYPGSPEEAKEDLIGFLKLIKERDERKKKK
jgi:transcriptional regulator with XRE-family HTH domain